MLEGVSWVGRSLFLVLSYLRWLDRWFLPEEAQEDDLEELPLLLWELWEVTLPVPLLRRRRVRLRKKRGRVGKGER